MNGVESTKKLVASIEKELASQKEAARVGRRVSFAADNDSPNENGHVQSDEDHESDITQYSDEPEANEETPKRVQQASKPVAEPETPRRRSTRTKAGGRKG